MLREFWIEAGEVLALDPKAVVKCPECGEADLTVFDTKAGRDHIERHMRCPKCGAHNALYKNISCD
ncbi:hypothetical protein MesoLj113a_53920 [Mesorhizobium sp. 113-1-2]|uniref:hypothetical protein n=1 Tax=Mesorhizobium sp. 113-1-2 TaxID=2744515 RepID=UPI0008197FA6|nr:hypothetical protein [Mesorhizobium sp. 113-1-2]BAV52096.1 Uncharacterized protein MLTONO_7194 [Mesorhizobium loti]BCG74234.1 hypothetical protein MesoLj113a_53920 [Mesorhizobium sp. 113-1-2]